jgi:hypothetical protein
MVIVKFVFGDFENCEGFQMRGKSISRGKADLTLLNAHCKERMWILCIPVRNTFFELVIFPMVAMVNLFTMVTTVTLVIMVTMATFGD